MAIWYVQPHFVLQIYNKKRYILTYVILLQSNQWESNLSNAQDALFLWMTVRCGFWWMAGMEGCGRSKVRSGWFTTDELEPSSVAAHKMQTSCLYRWLAQVVYILFIKGTQGSTSLSPSPKKQQRSILFISLANFQLELIKTIRYKSSLMDDPPSLHIVF